MECNREEAVRAMQLSEMKMQQNDFMGARKMAQKAQRLFPEIENIEKLLTVCEVHCSSGNKIGGSEMDWYGILQIQKNDNEVTIKKQYRKLALLLHPDKNKFAGAEAAFKLVGEANRVLVDQAKRSMYDIKCRALGKAAPSKPSAHPSSENLFVRKHKDTASNCNNIPQAPNMNQPQQVQDTFWTCCPYCKIKYQYYKDFANRLLRCQKCRRAFVAHDLGPQFQAVHPESVRNIPNRNDPESQGTSNVASQSKRGTGNPFTRFQNGYAASNPVSKEGVAADVRMASNKKRGRKSTFESSESGKTKPSEVNGGHHQRRSSRIKQNLSYNGNLNNDDATVSPTEKERKNAPADGRVSKNDSSSDSASTAAVGGHKKEAKQKATAPPEECLPSKRSKTGEFEQKVKEAAMPGNADSKPNADVDSGPNSNVTSMPETVEVPDPEFNKFVLDEGMLKDILSANQIWALFDPVDGMPRFYARIKKVVFTPGLKLYITWLEPNPDDQGEIAWCDKELPVACGKYTLGNTDEVTDHLMLSHRMHWIKPSGRSTLLVYPRKGETWALYQNWDIGWSSEPETHMPFKFEFVEVLSDFDEDNGIGVAYLGKVKGFVSLFQRSEQQGVVLFQVAPNELYRFSHQIPSFKMTGNEREGVPIGSFEFDPASLPTNLDDFADLKMGNGTMDTELNGASCEFLQSEPKPVMGSGRKCTTEKQEKNSERATSMCRSPRKSNSEFAESVKPKATECVSVDNGINQGNPTQPKGSATPGQADERINTPKKHHKNDSDGEAFGLRRSPRELSKNSTGENETTKRPESANNESHASFTQSKIHSYFRPKISCTTSQPDDNLHSSVKDRPSVSSMKSSAAPPSSSPVSSMKSPAAPQSSSPACRLSQTQLYDFDGLRSEEKFHLGQIWALYSDKNGMPKTYAVVRKIDSKPNFQLHMALLEPCLESDDMIEPVCCGKFKADFGQTKVFPLTSFSHCLNNARLVGKKMFEIKPRKGEVWALYKNQNLGKGECEIVEVLEDNDQTTKVVVLSQLNGLKSVFKRPRMQRSKTGVINIPQAELGRFSHQIPAFHHTGESDSRLAGCWELNPLSIPGIATVQS